MKKTMFIIKKIRFKQLSTFVCLNLLALTGLKATTGNLLIDGNMESDASWHISYLGTTDTIHSTWNYTADIPSAGSGGCLHLTDTATVESQFCIYQPVTLDSTKTYVFNGALKSLLKGTQNYWIQAYIGTQAPTDTADLGAAFTQIAQFNFWTACQVDSGFDGTFKANSCDLKSYTSSTNNTLYFALKIGHLSGAHFDFLVDELSLMLDTVKPTATITSTSLDTIYYAFPITITFSKAVTGFTESSLSLTNCTVKASSFVAVNAMVYTATIVPTTSGAVTIGVPAGVCVDNNNNNNLAATDLVRTYLAPVNLLIGGNMENASDWNITYLNAKDTIKVIWDYTGDLPAAGSGGCLYLYDTATAGTQYCIWQPVILKAHSTYAFTGAVKDHGGFTDAWNQVYVGTTPPATGADYTTAIAGVKQIIEFNDYDCHKAAGFDGTYQANGCGGSSKFYADTAGTYYLAIKTGNNPTNSLGLLIDELSLIFVPDTIAPSVTIVTAPVDTVRSAFKITVTYSEAVTGFTESDISVTNGTKKAGTFSAKSASTYIDTIVPTNPGAVTINIAAGACTDLNSNASLAATPRTVIYELPLAIENNLTSTTRIYPNPVAGDLNYEITGFSGIASFYMYNLVGTMIYQKELTSSKGNINLPTSIKSGAYIVKIRNGDAIQVLKLIKQ